MSLIQAIYDFMQGCPLLDGDGKVRVNFLGEEPIEYVIEEVPAEPIVKRFLDGSSVRQMLFIFGSREDYDKNAVQNMISSSFYERLSEWLEKQTHNGDLPILPESMEAQSIEAVTTAYAIEADELGKTARYQIQCKLTYYKEAIT